MSHSTTAPRRVSLSGGAWTALSDADVPPHIAPTTSDTWTPPSPLQYQSLSHRDNSDGNPARIAKSASHVDEHETLLGEALHNNAQARSDSTPHENHGKDAGPEDAFWGDSNNTRGEWEPFTLRPVFLRTMAIVTLALAITLAVLCWYSARHNGLARDADTAGLLFARRYLPTILAVVLTQVLVIISNDIKRTEPFARLARPERPDVKHTLLYTSKAWWSTMREGLVRQRNSGRIGWVLVLSSLATGISLLAVSTLSSSLLASEQVVFRSNVNMKRFNPAQIALVPRREVYFHATSGFLFNATTSMWVSDSHIVFPFGPSDLYNYPDFLPEGDWKVKTKVLQMESNCKPMRFAEFQSIYQPRTQEVYDPPGTNMAYNSASNRSYAKYLMNQDASKVTDGFTLDSDDGCHIQVLAEIDTRGDHRIVRNGGLLWTNLSSSYVTYDQFVQGRGTPPLFRSTEWSPTDTGLMFDFSKDCIGRNLLLVTTPWSNNTNAKRMTTKNFQVRAEICTSEVFEAMVDVSASITSDAKSLALDRDALSSQRTKVSNNLLDLDVIQELTFGRDRVGYVDRAKTLMGNYAFEGLSEALSAVYSFDTSTMLKTSSLAEESTRLSKRFFGELLLSAITKQRSSGLDDMIGEETHIEQRIVVVTETAATLSVLLFLLSCYLVFLGQNAAARRRPLGLRSDPATTFGLGAYLQRHTYLLKMMDAAKDQDERMHHSPYHISTVASADETTKNPGMTVKLRSFTGTHKTRKMTAKTWKPHVIRTVPLLSLLGAFIAIAVLLLVLHSFAVRQMLYRSAFVYQVDLHIFRAKFSPHSLLATLVAVGVSMWWDAIDKVLRTVQPFLSMSKVTTDVRLGAALSYQSSYWFRATVRAVSNRHWLLALVTLGTTLCQILIVSIAAIFERGPGSTTSVAHATSTYAIRQAPLFYNYSKSGFNNLHDHGVQSPFLQDTMRIVTSDWLYSALDQISLDSEQPSWSRDGWSFTPVDMDSLPPVSNLSRSSASSAETDNRALLVSTANSTLTTSALRARLECGNVETRNPLWFTKNEVDLFSFENSTDATAVKDRLNRTGYILPSTIFENTTRQTSIYSRASKVICCSNETDITGRSAVGYWSQMNTTQWWKNDPSLGSSSWIKFGPDIWPPHFAVKWILGPTVTSNVTAYTNGAASHYKIMQFTDVPSMTFLDCKPVIEKAEAEIVVARTTGQVLSFNILNAPQPQIDPWSAHFNHLNESDKKSTVAQVSYGSYFLTQLLGASSIAPLVVQVGFYPPFDFENIDDDRFNIRDKEKGYNMDFMSYANLYQANMDPSALLDPIILEKYSQRTFQTFFQHFASKTKWTDGQIMVYEKPTSSHTDKVKVTTTQRIETLTMIASATWLSLAIIFILVVILIIVIVSLKILYPHNIMRNNIDCLADVLDLIQGSEALLWYAERHDVKKLRESGLKTRLDWFKDRGGAVRYGVELLDAPWIEWIEKPDDFEMDERTEAET